MANYYKMLQNGSERFNTELFELKQKDEMVKYIDIVAQTMEALSYVKYNGCRIIPEHEMIKNSDVNEVNKSRLETVVLSYTIDYENKITNIEIPIKMLKLIDGNYFIYNGVKYTPIFQVVDITYALSDRLVLKTLTMGIFIRFINSSITTIDESFTFSGHEYSIASFDKDINVLSYYLAENGLDYTMSMFDIDKNDIVFYRKQPTEVPENHYLFCIHKLLFASVNKDIFAENDYRGHIALTLLQYLKKKKAKIDTLYDSLMHKRRLGSFFTKSINSESKADKVLTSFRRLLDTQTRYILNIDDAEKKDTYTIIKHLIKNFKSYYNRDNMDLRYKRIRFYEYMLMPLLQQLSNNLFRIFNKRDNPSLEGIQTIFSIKDDFLIKKLLGNELIRYDNISFNNLDIFNMLKCSQKGPQSLASNVTNANEIAMTYRSVHSSYIGKVSLIHSNAGDPGMNYMLTPFLKLNPKMYFKKEVNEEIDGYIKTLMDK